MSTRGTRTIATTCFLITFFHLACGPGRAAFEEDRIIPLLKTRTSAYTNVTITSRTAKELCILHAGGAGNVHLDDLVPESQELVGYEPPLPAGEKLRALAAERAATVMRFVPMELEGTAAAGADGFDEPAMELSPLWMGALIGGFLIGYLLYCHCLKLICVKAGHEPGAIVWLPVLQVFPMLRAAGMSGWWVLGMLLPLLNLVVWILWCFNIVSARGKSAVWAVLLILPFTNLIAFLYLAFSGDGNHEEERPPRVPALAIRPV